MKKYWLISFAHGDHDGITTANHISDERPATWLAKSLEGKNLWRYPIVPTDISYINAKEISEDEFSKWQRWFE